MDARFARAAPGGRQVAGPVGGEHDDLAPRRARPVLRVQRHGHVRTGTEAAAADLDR